MDERRPSEHGRLQKEPRGDKAHDDIDADESDQHRLTGCGAVKPAREGGGAMAAVDDRQGPSPPHADGRKGAGGMVDRAAEGRAVVRVVGAQEADA